MTPDELKHALGAARERLVRALEGLTDKEAHRRPTPEAGPWAIGEVLGHLLSTNRLWCDRARLALEDEDARIAPSPEGSHEEGARSGRRAPLPQLVHGLQAAKREAERLIDSAAASGENGLQRSAWHPRLGERLTVEWMVREKLAGHEMEHAKQIEGMRAKTGDRS